jgi:hypothetical protein
MVDFMSSVVAQAKTNSLQLWVIWLNLSLNFGRVSPHPTDRANPPDQPAKIETS